MHQLKEIIFTYSIIEQMEGNVMMGKYLEYFEDVDLDMLVDHCLWHNARESVESGGQPYIPLYHSFGNKLFE